MQIVFTILLTAFATVIIRQLWTSRYEFIVRVHHGKPRVVKGKIPASLLGEVEELCMREGLESASIKGICRGGRVSLVFSRHVPRPCRQQLRNVWSLPR